MVRESTITKSIIAALRRRYTDIFVMKLHGGPYQLRGVPDLLVIVRGLPIFFEVKTPGKGKRNEPTPLQRVIMDRIRKAGAIATCVHSVEEAVALLDGMP